MAATGGGLATEVGGPPPALIYNGMTVDQIKALPKAKKLAIFSEIAQGYDQLKTESPISCYKPLPTPERFHRSTARIRQLLGGNRSSKTTSGCAEDIFWLNGSSPYRSIPKGPLHGVITGLSLDLVERSLIKILNELKPKAHFQIEFSKSRGGGTITGPNGMAYIKSNEQGWESFQAMELNFAHEDEEHDYEVHTQVRKRLKRGSKLQIWLSMTPEPDRGDHWTYDEIYRPATAINPDPEIEVFCISLNENRVSRGGYLLDSEIDYIIANTPEDHRPAVIEGMYVKRGGLMYPMWTRDRHLAYERPLSFFMNGIAEGVYTPYCWFDWGVRNPTAIGLVVEDKEGNVQLIDEIYRSAKDATDIKEEYARRFAQFRPRFVVADPSIWYAHESADPSRSIGGILEADDYERKISGLPLIHGSNDHVNGDTAIRELLSYTIDSPPKFTVQPRCSKFIYEIENYVGEEYIQREKERNKKETGRKVHNHHMDGFCYWANSAHGHEPLPDPGEDSGYEVSEVGFMRHKSNG